MWLRFQHMEYLELNIFFLLKTISTSSLLMTSADNPKFANGWEPVQDRLNVGSDLDSNGLILWVGFLNDRFYFCIQRLHNSASLSKKAKTPEISNGTEQNTMYFLRLQKLHL